MRIKHYLGAHETLSCKSASTSKSQKEIETARLPEGTSKSDKWKLGGCPRCHGDVFLDSEDGQVLGHCLQCGYVGARVISPPKVLSLDE
jgi:hypothetical protein